MKIISDTHMHTFFSFDGRNTSAEMTEAAYRKGLKYICFTEHHNENPDFYKPVDYDSYFSTIEKLKKEYEGKITVLAGIEYDQPELFPHKLKELQTYPFDMIMGSMHNVFDMYAGTDELFRTRTPEEVMREYYRLTTVAARQGMFDVVGHFDLPLRSCPNPEVDLRKERMNALRALAENNIALEINANGMRCGYGRTLPTESVLREYAEVGGKYVLFGSDAHCTDDIAKPFEQIENYDLCGLTPGVFIKREFVPIYNIN